MSLSGYANLIKSWGVVFFYFLEDFSNTKVISLNLEEFTVEVIWVRGSICGKFNNGSISFRHKSTQIYNVSSVNFGKLCLLKPFYSSLKLLNFLASTLS